MFIVFLLKYLGFQKNIILLLYLFSIYTKYTKYSIKTSKVFRINVILSLTPICIQIYIKNYCIKTLLKHVKKHVYILYDMYIYIYRLYLVMI